MNDRAVLNVIIKKSLIILKLLLQIEKARLVKLAGVANRNSILERSNSVKCSGFQDHGGHVRSPNKDTDKEWTSVICSLSRLISESDENTAYCESIDKQAIMQSDANIAGNKNAVLEDSAQ